MPFVPNAQADLTGYVTEKGLAGIFRWEHSFRMNTR
jgi:hypothetical protein